MDVRNEIKTCLDSDISDLLDGNRKPFNHRVSQLADELGQKLAYRQVHDELIQRAHILEDQSHELHSEERRECERKAAVLREEAAIFSLCIKGSSRKTSKPPRQSSGIGQVLSKTGLSLAANADAVYI